MNRTIDDESARYVGSESQWIVAMLTRLIQGTRRVSDGSIEHEYRDAEYESEYEQEYEHEPGMESEAELTGMRHSLARGTPFGDAHWPSKTAAMLGLESSVRPPKQAKAT